MYGIQEELRDERDKRIRTEEQLKLAISMRNYYRNMYNKCFDLLDEKQQEKILKGSE